MLLPLRSFTFVALIGLMLAVRGVGAQGSSEAWNTPSDKVDSAVAAWATKQLAPQAEVQSPPPVPTEIPTTEPNPFQPEQPKRVEQAPLASRPAVKEPPVRYDPDASGLASANPLRTGSVRATAPAPLSNAERAFSASQPARVESRAAREAFQQDFSPAAPSMPRAPVERPSPPIALVQELAPTPAEPSAPERASAPRISLATPPVERSVIQRASPPQEPQAWNPQPAALSAEPYEIAPSVSEGQRLPGDPSLEGPQQASLTVEKRGPDEARIGQVCRFVIRVRNQGRQTAQQVVLRDATPEGTRLVDTDPPAESTGEGLLWRLGAIAPGQERRVELRVEPQRQGAVGSVATVSFATQASAKTRCTSPELALRLTAPARVRVGARQPVHVEIRNPGSGVATGVAIVQEVPSNLRHEAGSSLEFEVGSLAPGEQRKIDLMLTAEEAGHVVNTLTASADGGLRVEQSVEFDVVAPELELSVEGPQRRYLERPASYTVNIDNPGSAAAKDVRLVTHLPRGLKFVRANNLGEYDSETHSVYWSLAELPQGERGAVQLVAMPVASGEHTLRVESEASDGLKVSKSSQLVVEGVASLAFDIRDRQDPIEVGSEALYDVVVTNEGTQAASNVRVTVEAPSGMRIVDAQGKVAHRLLDGKVEFAPLPSLHPGEKFPYRVRLRGEQPGDQRVTVLVESDGLDQPIRREESTRVFGDE